MIHNETIDNILERRTIRDYTAEQISSEELETLMTCAMWAPSARNLQPCHLRVIQSRSFLEEMNLDFKNLVGWDTPAYTNWDKNPFYQNAPTVLFLFAEGESGMDAGLMTENVTIAAKSMGLGTCIIGSIGALFESAQGGKWKIRLDVPENWRFLIAVAVGHGCENPAPKARKTEQFKIVKAES